MTLSSVWIRNNMLFCDQHERQLTEAELKVQRSIQKLSIPDWYLNKRSNPPKILNNIAPIEYRQPSWKCPKKDSTLGSTSYDLSGTPPPESVEKNSTDTYKVSKQEKFSESKQKSRKSKKDLPFDTSIPEVKLPKKNSKTFPKMSPSRKIQNINLVFPPKAELDLSEDLEEDVTPTVSLYKTFIVAKKPAEAAKKKEDTNRNEKAARKSLSKKLIDTHRSPEKLNASPRTPKSGSQFTVRATSTPKFTPVNLFSSTIIEETPKTKKAPSPIILEISSIFEDPRKTSTSKATENVAKVSKKQSQSFLEKTSFFEDSCKSQSSESMETPRKSRLSLFEKNIRSIDPILFEKEDSPATARQPSLVRDIVNRIEVSKEATPSKRSNKNHLDAQQRKSKPKQRDQVLAVREKIVNLEAQSPCTRFMNSRRKSTDLENVIRSKQPGREKNAVKEIIETLTGKAGRFSLYRDNNVSGQNSSFVRSLVTLLEKGDTLRRAANKSLLMEDDTESSSESEGKSCTTSASPKDTDSDSDQRSSTLKSDDEACRFRYDPASIKKQLDNAMRTCRDEDSVYWIPVSRCKLPRTSSLISMMSKLSGNGQSPCVSPIRSDSDAENSQAWGATLKKNHALTKKLFKIDETTVIDSGYSDKSDRSGSIVDTTWSEDVRNDSGLEAPIVGMRSWSRRNSIIANAHSIYV